MSQNAKEKDALDAWVIFEHLHTAMRKDIVDYLIHQLYYLSDNDVDFFLPQLCTLLVTRDTLSKQLETFILHKCMKSIDFAIKCFWNLHAIQFYAKIDSQRDRCDELRQNLEMIVVNGSLSKSLLDQIPKDIRMQIIAEQEQEQKNHLKNIENHNKDIHESQNDSNNKQKTQNAQKKSPQFLPAPNNTQSQNSNKNGHNSSSSVSDDDNNSKNKQTLSSSLPIPKTPDHVRNKNFIVNGATRYLKKQRRCTYFNAELDFAHFLEGVSSALEQCDSEDRPRLLEDNMRYANKCLPRGLYVPIGHLASDKHKSLLRIVPGEGKCLDSKQKVPFLLFCEVEDHVYPTSSPQICEELTESETALLSSSGLYVLIDEHRRRNKKTQSNGKSSGETGAEGSDELQSAPKKVPHPKRLKATKRKPSKRKLSITKLKNIRSNRKKNKEIEKANALYHQSSSDNAATTSSSPASDNSNNSNKSRSNSKLLEKFKLKKRNRKLSPNSAVKSSNGSLNNTPTPSVNGDQSQSRTLDYSVSRSRIYSDEDCESKNESPSAPEPSKSRTNTFSLLNQNAALPLSNVPTPLPKPKDVMAEETMRAHLRALEPFEPKNHKSPKKMENNNNNLRIAQAQQEMERSSSYNALLSPDTADKFRAKSKTPTPHMKSPLHKKSIQISKSDGNQSSSSSADDNTDMNGKMNGNGNVSNGQNKQIIVINKVQNGNNNVNAPQLQSGSVSGRKVIHRHPNYVEYHANPKLKKLQYLTGKSMQWKDPFGEPWNKRRTRYRQKSPFKELKRWNMQSVIFKSGEDMRQEQLAMQLIKLFAQIFKDAKLPLQLCPYSVVVTSPASGFVETVPNAVSISRLKHGIVNFVSLRKFFEQFYGPVGSPGFSHAQKNFVESMAGYSLVQYFLQIKDRHNGNILLDCEGRVVHIDFDFLFSNSPGGNIGFESAPFKLTEEYIQVMGGETNSEMFDYFKILLIRGFLEARKHVRKFTLLSQIMLEGAPMPCFLAGKQVIEQLKERFAVKLKNEKCVEHVYSLIEESSCNWRSVQYDKFQRITNNIL